MEGGRPISEGENKNEKVLDNRSLEAHVCSQIAMASMQFRRSRAGKMLKNESGTNFDFFSSN